VNNITPIFVSGIGRSGTSAVIKALSKHKNIVAPSNIGEAPFVHHFLEFLSEYEDRSNSKEYNLKNYNLAESDRVREFSRLMALVQYGVDVYKKENEGKYWIAKASLTLDQKNKADHVFGHSKIVYIIRNGIEVVNSARSFSGFKDHTFEGLCYRWADSLKKCAYIKKCKDCAVIKHDELVSDPASVFEHIFDSLQLDFDDAPSKFIETNLFNSSFDSTAKNTNTSTVFENRLKCWDEWSDAERDIFIEICDSAMVENDLVRPYAAAAPVEKPKKKVIVESADNKGKYDVAIRDFENQLKDKMSAPQFDYYANPSLRNNYFYMENPKVASTTILKWLQEKEVDGDLDIKGNPHERDNSPIVRMSSLENSERYKVLESDEIYRFTFVRNPYSRLLSAYISKVVKNLRPKREILSIINAKPVDEIEDLSQEVSFSEFVEVVCSQKSRDMNAHWKPQSAQVLLGVVNYQYVGKFENLNSDYSRVHDKLFGGECKKLGLSKNATGSDKLISNYYGSAELEAVYKRYYDDFNGFEYEKGNCSILTKAV